MDYATQGISCQLSYIQSIPGILKIIELLCDLLAVILSGAAPVIDGASGHRGFFLFVSILALIVTTILLIMALLNVQNTFLRGRWPIIEMGWCAFIALFYFIASIVIATIAKYSGTYGGAAFFGFAAFITYVGDAIFQFRTYRSGSQSSGQQYATDNTAPPRPQPTY